MDPDIAQIQTSEAPEPSVEASAAPPPKKRAKTANIAQIQGALKRRGKKKSLSLLTDMPLDVIFEIFSNLLPGDLIALSRSNKAFRTLLFHRSSITVWRSARNNVPGLPDCPPELSEPAYANLLFTTNCHYCGRQGTQIIEWLLLTRCCKSCRENPAFFFDATNHPNDHKRDWLRSYLPSITRGRNTYVRMSDLAPFLEQWETQGNDNGGIDHLLKRSKEKTKLLKQRLLPHQLWDEQRNRNRELELDAIRKQRRRAVWDKLSETGLGDEKAFLNSSQKDFLRNMEGMKEPTPLTERNWLKIKDPIISWVQRARRERIREQRSAPYTTAINAIRPLLDAYGRTRPLTDCFPTTMDFCCIPQARAYIDELVTSGAALDAAHFTGLIPIAIQQWHNDASQHLYPLLPPWLIGTRHPDVLRSALVWFHCASKGSYPLPCNDTTIGYPRILVHTHTRHERRRVDEPQSPDDDLANAVCDIYLCSSYMLDPAQLKANITFDLHASFAAAEIVQLCGLDPSTASAEEMDELDARIACVPCKEIITWRKAVSHVYKPCHAGQREWVLLDDADCAALKKLEAKDRPKTTTGTFWCMRCRRFDRAMCNFFFSHKGLKALKAHMERAHGVVQFRPKYGVDYYVPDGEPTNDNERPLPVMYKELDFKVSTPELIALGW
ncbi:uncharacterized protein PHACADRAFT_208680 [Phanerochaete carnosa HHB-10118-sp]|uniref:F-box domain-containing protein n=1 Tax=Phanerochaete carnosa (strain HHB-10118-sp) TaxID=650164 RepID=K5W7K4_PHACS|nr:uncharacterized protein PHACADRAFT_208680 [Phanerochaete carnosa HHB-10118-sp]EKM55155.1 hypothetical protein PHACADRAFT_208680 [Phanerochaete carnosa HHB-10118-sp]